jgi:hypothetical protein
VAAGVSVNAVDEIVALGYTFLNPLQLAFHESGHALLAHRCGRVVSSVTVGQHGGLTHSEGPATPEIALVVAIAGGLAERLTPECVENLADLDVGSKDQADVDFALDVIGGDTLHRAFVLEDARRQVAALLTEQRDVLDRTARMLLQRRRLEGRELRALLQ